MNKDDDDDDDDEQQFDNVEDSFGPQVKQILDEFYNYMTGPDRGRKEKSVSSVVQDVKRILISVGAGMDINVIYDKDTDTLRNRYLNGVCKERATSANSIRKYLYSLKDFSKFLKAKKVEFVNLDYVNTAIQNIKMWRKNFSKKAKVKTFQERQNDYKMLVTPDQIKRYIASEQSLSAKRLFDLLSKNPAYGLSNYEYCILRDHLFVLIVFSNGCRSGVIVNMTLTEYSKARYFPEKKGYLIEVEEHKTNADFGAAPVFLNECDFQLLCCFVNNARSQLFQPDDEIFLSWNGKKLSPGDVSKRLHILWQRAGNFEGRDVPKNLCVNITRKSASTGIRELYKEDIQAVCDTMAHSEKTQQIHYWPRQRELSVLQGTSALRGYFFSEVKIN